MTSNVIAIDGPAGSGKSTVARAVAAQLGWSVLDTGAMYRAVTAEAIGQGVDLHDSDAVARIAASCVISTAPRVTINNRDVHDEIRTEIINNGVSIVAAISPVRSAMVERQREVAATMTPGVVVEGRDITTVVFPDARLKIFLTANISERARRRNEEGEESVERRDAADSNRSASPLRQSPDAIVIDTTNLSVEEVVEVIVRCLENTSSN